MSKTQSIPLLMDLLVIVILPSQPNFCQQVDLETSNLGELWQGCNYVNNSCHGPVADNNQVLEKIDRSSQYELNTKTKGNLAIPHQVPSLNVFFHPTGYWTDGSTEINYLCIVNTTVCNCAFMQVKLYWKDR